MPIDAPLLSRQSVFAAKVETTTGTDASLAASDGAMNVYDASIVPDIPANERQGQSSLSPLPTIPGARAATITLRTELHGSGSSGAMPLWADTFLKAAGFGYAAGVYTVATGSSSFTSLTCGHYIDGHLHKALGCVFDLNIDAQVGTPAQCNWTGRGAWQAPTAVALIAPTYPTVIPPRVASATVTIGGTAYKWSRVGIAMNNGVVLREDASKVSGYISGYIANRRIRLTVDPEEVALGTKDWYADWMASTELAFSCAIGSAANNTITIAMPKCSIERINPASRNGLHVADITFVANRSAAAGDDELTITFS